MLGVWCFGLCSSFAQWSDVAPGISYREFTQPGPVRVFVTRADRSTNTWTIDSMTSMGEIKGGHEVVQVGLPAVVMGTQLLGEPRYPSLRGIMAARGREIVTWNLVLLLRKDDP